MTEEASHREARDMPPGSTDAAESPRSARAVVEPGRARPGPVRRLSVVCLAAAAAAAVLYVITVGTPAGQLIGELILGGRPADVQATERAGRILATVSGNTVGIGLVVVVAIALLQKRPRLALAAAAAIVAANVTTQLLKETLLERTDLLDRLFYPLPNSFPSGHATAAASIAVGLIVVLPPLFRSPAIIAAAIGGVFVATAWGAGLAAVLAWRRGVEVVGRRTAAVGRISARIAITIGFAALLVGGSLYALAVTDPLNVLLDLAERGGSPALFVLGILVTIGASFVALGGLGFALRDVRLDPPPMSAKRTDHD
jgi:hypothetical protein